MRDTVTLGEPPAAGRLALTHSDGTRVRAVGVESRSLTTLRRELTLGEPGADVAHAAVVERHRGTGRIGLGYATGFGLRRGAMASTVAHDAHNCVTVGARAAGGPDDMAVAVARLAELGGGQVAVLDGRVRGRGAAAARRADERPPGGRGGGADPRAEPRRGGHARRHARGALHAAVVPGALGDPGAAPHRRRPRRRGRVRLRAGRGLTPVHVTGMRS